MALERPKSMDGVAYYSRRKIGDKGEAEVWVFKKACECGKLPKRKGKFKETPPRYICECGKETPANEYEDLLTANIAYSCPSCGNSGELQMPFKRKNVSYLNKETGKRKAIKSLQFKCEKCGYTINFTKKLKKQVVLDDQCLC